MISSTGTPARPGVWKSTGSPTTRPWMGVDHGEGIAANVAKPGSTMRTA